MQLKLVIVLVVSVLCMFALDAEAKRKRQENNICKRNKNGLPPTDGLQILEGSCSTTIQGEIPAHDKMPSTLILEPENGKVIKAHKEFEVKLRVNNLLTGHFSDPANGTYYTKPQELGNNGLVLGHVHVTIQEIKDPHSPLDADEFSFFKGLEDAGTKISGHVAELSTKVEDGLEPGNYRLCTLSSSETHQPLIMPVAKRGAQDDCIRFEVKYV